MEGPRRAPNVGWATMEVAPTVRAQHPPEADQSAAEAAPLRGVCAYALSSGAKPRRMVFSLTVRGAMNWRT